MKKIRVFLLTLVLSISMLAPEFSMLPAAYAQDVAPAATAAAAVEGAESVDTAPSAESAEAPTGTDQGATAPAAGNDASAEAPVAGSDTSADAQAGAEAVPASPETAKNSIDTNGEAGADAGATAEAAPAPAAEPDGTAAEDPAEPTSYDRIDMTALESKGAVKIPDKMKDKIDVSHVEDGDGVLFKGKVADLNSTLIDLGYDFNFDSGSVGRLSFDGLKDKDKGMSVYVGVYIDGSKTPLTEIPLKKQMGKKEWTNDGEKSVSLGEAGIKGKHKVSLGFRIEGKDESKKTTVMIRSLRFCRTTVPVMYFNIDESEGTIVAMNSSEDHSVECYGDVDLIVPDEFNKDTTFRDEYGEQESLKGLELEYIRGRGNSTWTADKKPYKVKFDKSQDLFGFGANKHWTLLADRFDNSLVRNRMTYHLGRALGMEYTPECVPVEVVMNGEYYGSYLLCEQIRVGKGRVTIDDLDDVKDAPAVTDKLIQTGGYLLSMDWGEDEDVRVITTENGMQAYIESPDENVKYFHEYIKAFMQKVENAIFSPDYKDASGRPYTDYLDLDAAVDYWWIQEFSENGDAYSSGSTYLYKTRDTSENEIGKLYWGPLWDFDFVAWGDLDYDSEPAETLNYTTSSWFEEMKGDPQFINRIKTRWSEKGGLRDQIKAITNEGGLLDKYKKQMKTVYDYDHEKWGANESNLTEYSGEIEQLRTWIIRRTAYVDDAITDLKVEDHKVKFVVDGKVVSEVITHGILRGMPEVPEKKGYTFTGWESKDGVPYGEGDIVTEDLVLTAVYMTKEDYKDSVRIFFRDKDVYYAADMIGNDGEEGMFLEYCIMPDEASDTEIKWTSSDESIAEEGEDGFLTLKKYGDVKITARLANGYSKSVNLHIVNPGDLKEFEGFKLNKSKMTLKVGQYGQVIARPYPQPCWESDFIYVSMNEKVATVNEMGVVTGIKPGTTEILAIASMSHTLKKCKVTVRPAKILGSTFKYKGNTYKVTSNKKGSRKVMLVKAKNAKSVVIPASVPYCGYKYSVTKIKSKAFSKSKATKVTIKTKKLKKSTVKGSLKNSKVKTVRVLLGKKSLSSRYAKKYRKIFTKKNAGKKVTVK